MKPLFLIFALSVVLMIAACVKDSGSVNSKSLTGTWGLVSDSTYSSGVGASNSASGSKYMGASGDHFIFTGNTLTIKEGSLRNGKANYTIAKDTLKLTYTELNGANVVDAQDIYIIKQSGYNSLELDKFFITPGGIIKEFIVLSR